MQALIQPLSALPDSQQRHHCHRFISSSLPSWSLRPSSTHLGFSLQCRPKHNYPDIGHPISISKSKPSIDFPISIFKSKVVPIALSSTSLSWEVQSSPNPVVVVGSANADIYVEIDRLPQEGETVAARSGQTLAGGKGANQACCAAKLASPGRSAYFVGQVGDDAHGRLIRESLAHSCSDSLCLDCLAPVPDVPTGHAVVMLQPDGQNSIIIVGGANMGCWPDRLRHQDLELLAQAGILLLQREIPDRVNLLAAKAANSSGAPVVLDAGGVESPIPSELLKHVDILSPNETELARLTGMPTNSFEEICQAAVKCYEMGVKRILVKLGAKGSALFIEGQEPIRQPIIPAAKVIDTTGAGDTFTAAFAVALVEGKSQRECLRFAAAAASLCVQVKGAIPSMPERNAVEELLKSL